jgi:signal transduction histidine kinase
MTIRRTIRFRISALAALLSFLLFGVVSVFTVLILRNQLMDNFDEGLRQRAETIAATAADTAQPQLANDEDLLIQLVASDGAILAASAPVVGLAQIVPLSPGFHTIKIPNRTETFRVYVRTASAVGRSAFVIVGVNLDDVTDPVSILSRLLALMVPLVALALGGLTWWLVGRTLRPVENMRREMLRISGSNLSGRVNEPGTGDEIARLAQTMNGTLDRLESSAIRQRRFVGDASHELRGPLTRIRTELELDLAHPERSEPLATHQNVLSETVGLQFLVDDLLLLASSDAQAIELNLALIDLDDVVLREARSVIERGRVRIDLHGVQAVQVRGDARKLARAVKNLLDNAERHATTSVAVTLEEVDGEAGAGARLTVSDDGRGISPELREKVFERFTRLDEARTRDAGGAGLGLAIARDIVERHRGTLMLADGPTTRFVIELPNS